MNSIYTIGEVLVEMMAANIGQGFTHPGVWHGPYPSGAPAIFIDQVSKLGVRGGIISCVGDDGFGRLNVDRLARDGVDTRGIRMLTQENTGSAFVAYQSGGERDFIFNIKHSACGHISPEQVVEMLPATCRHLHIMGSSLFSFQMVDAVKKAAEQVKAAGGTLSFDPNIRKEMLDISEMRDALHFMLELTDCYLPSASEVVLLSPASDAQGAIDWFLQNGIREVVVKRGREGASYFSAEQTLHVPGYPVIEVDPTGAGDCFGGAFIACRQRGFSISQALRYANVCGALAVTRQGPMEGTSTLTQIEAFLQRQTPVSDNHSIQERQ
ncbi:sugar kinase [Sodalis sp. TME1]|nr:sugar kinase [Sodalis sp. TME1]